MTSRKLPVAQRTASARFNQSNAIVYTQETYDMLVRIIRDKLDVADDWIVPHRLLSDGFEIDSEDVDYMIEDICKYFNIQDPAIHDWDKYELTLIAHDGVCLWDLFRFWLRRLLRPKRQARLIFEGMTIADLCETIENGRWPRKYLVPYGYTDEPPQRG